MIIGIAGTLGAGKGTVVEYLKQEGFLHYSSSGRLKEILEERGLLSDRPHLSALADELLQTYQGGVLEASYKKAQAEGAKNYILESIHRLSELEFMRSIGAIIIGVDAETNVRYERSVRRQEGEKDNVTYDEFLSHIEREENGKGEGTPNIRAVLEQADFVLNNNGTLAELHQQIDEILQKISPANNPAS